MRSQVSLARNALVCAALLLPGCTGSSGDPIPGPTPSLGPVPAVLSSDLAVGKNRFLFTLLDGRSGSPVARPDHVVRVDFFDLARSDTFSVAAGDASFLWADPEREGVFEVPVEFAVAGPWEAEVQVEGAPSARVSFDVAETPATPRAGQKAPPSATRTLNDVDGNLGALTSDPSPLRRFYRTSIAQAIGLAVPFVVVFGSPGHCSSSGCAHLLDVAKAVAAGTTDLTFIHVELYRDAAAEFPASSTRRSGSGACRASPGCSW